MNHEHSTKFLTPEQTAEFLGGIHPRTLTAWAREGYVPAYPIGEGKRHIWRFRAHDLEQRMLNRKTGLQRAAQPVCS